MIFVRIFLLVALAGVIASCISFPSTGQVPSTAPSSGDNRLIEGVDYTKIMSQGITDLGTIYVIKSAVISSSQEYGQFLQQAHIYRNSDLGRAFILDFDKYIGVALVSAGLGSGGPTFNTECFSSVSRIYFHCAVIAQSPGFVSDATTTIIVNYLSFPKSDKKIDLASCNQ
jgi:hypothetical protein